MARKPIVAGQFYAGDKIKLLQQISECFNSGLGPGKTSQTQNKHILGVIAPHAGYMFSGPCQAFSYREIAESIIPETIILLGLSHNGFPCSLSMEDWETPLGIMRNDREFQKELAATYSLPVDEQAHAFEHSIEVQLPFIQYIMRDHQVRIAPIIASQDIPYEELASDIYKTIRKTKKKVMVVASSDFTHYGSNYGFVPFRDNIKKNMYKLDKQAIRFIEKLQAAQFLDYIEQTGATICGKYPVAVLIELCSKLGAQKASLLKYYTSGDIVGDYTNAVGYASIKIE